MMLSGSLESFHKKLALLLAAPWALVLNFIMRKSSINLNEDLLLENFTEIE